MHPYTRLKSVTKSPAFRIIDVYTMHYLVALVFHIIYNHSLPIS